MARHPKRRGKRKTVPQGARQAAPSLAVREERRARLRVSPLTLGIAVAVALLAVGGGWLVLSRTTPVVAPPNPDLTGVDAPIAEKIRSLTDTVSEHPRSAEGWGRLALTLHAHSFLAEAVSAYAQAAALDPDEFDWPYLAGLALHHQESDEAIEWFERAYELRPDYTPLLLNYARSLLAAGLLEEATVMFQRVLSREPASPHAHLGLARVAVLQEDLAGARRHLEQALMAAPLDPEVHALLAQVLSRQGESEAAELELKRSKQAEAFAPFPDSVYLNVAREGVGSFWHLRRGEDLMRWGNYAAAAAEFEQAVRLSPDVASHTRLGAALDRLGQSGDAVRHLEAAVTLAPTNVDALRHLSAALFAAGRYDEAVARAEDARRFDPTASAVYLLLSQLHARSGEWRDAVAVLRQGHAQVPDDARIAAALAWLLATAPEPSVTDGSEAVRLASIACDLTSHRIAEPLDALAAAYAENGQFEQAMATAQQALRIARQARRTNLANDISVRLEAYRAGRPWRVR
jgi:tetratricopeptide (TPR) repeat protein